MTFRGTINKLYRAHYLKYGQHIPKVQLGLEDPYEVLNKKESLLSKYIKEQTRILLSRRVHVSLVLNQSKQTNNGKS